MLVYLTSASSRLFELPTTPLGAGRTHVIDLAVERPVTLLTQHNLDAQLTVIEPFPQLFNGRRHAGVVWWVMEVRRACMEFIYWECISCDCSRLLQR